jgi:hypothetical protein
MSGSRVFNANMKMEDGKMYEIVGIHGSTRVVVKEGELYWLSYCNVLEKVTEDKIAMIDPNSKEYLFVVEATYTREELTNWLKKECGKKDMGIGR